jgi:PAS domain S-box-containing protein
VPILMVDDDPMKRLALKAVLAPLGHTVVEATSGREALRCLLDRDFAIILLDVMMPIMDGFETAALIRQRRQSEMTPIIFVTARGHDEVAPDDLYAAGAVDFIFAPVRPNEMRAKVSFFANLYLRAEQLAAKVRLVQASADRLRLLTDAAPVGIFQTDSEGRYSYTNPYWSAITGIAASDAVGRSLGSILSPEVEVSISELGPAAELSRRFEIPGPGPEPRVVLLTSKLIDGLEGGAAGWVGTVSDVTAEAGAEAAMAAARDQATEAYRLKSDFLANMSHEIRTPMNGVIGMIELLLETDLDSSQRDYAQTVHNSGEALLTIIDDILDFSKLEAGKLQVEQIAFNPGTIVGDVVDLLGGLARAKGIELVAAVDESVPAWVDGDPGRVRQVLTNLIGNAIKFTAKGVIKVRLGTTTRTGSPARPGNEDDLRFEVSDTGVGIDDDQLELIFQPFVQADTSISRRYGGTGLGLAISAQLIGLMGGDCGVSSEAGVGSTFWFSLAARSAAAGGSDAHDDAPVDSRVLEDSTASMSKGRLLLAEDNAINQKVAVAMLTSSGFLVDTVSDGVEAVKAAAAFPYDAILMDCHMPELDGFEATCAIRTREGASRHTPIIALTAAARQEDRDRCLAAGMDNYLSKPVSKYALVALVRQSIERAAERDNLVEIDLSVLADLEDLGGPDLVSELFTMFREDVSQHLAVLRQAIDDGDRATVERVAHAVAGSSADVGARRVAEAASYLEGLAATGALDALSHRSDELVSRWHRACQALADQLPPPASLSSDVVSPDVVSAGAEQAVTGPTVAGLAVTAPVVAAALAAAEPGAVGLVAAGPAGAELVAAGPAGAELVAAGPAGAEPVAAEPVAVEQISPPSAVLVPSSPPKGTL